MNPEKIATLQLLKQKVEAQFRANYPACDLPIQDWKGKTIVQFQEDLSKQVGGYVSEKWFYTHLKTTENKKFPRVDMLDMLVRYIGSESWAVFRMENEIRTPLVDEEGVPQKDGLLSYATYRRPLWLAGVLGSGILIAFILFAFQQDPRYRFCIVDQDDNRPIPMETIQVFWLKEGESPLKLELDSLGCVEMASNRTDMVVLKLEALYYKPKTITRKMNGGTGEELVRLEKDDYALMLHYFSTKKTKDWQSRRKHLEQILSDDLKVIQISEQTGGGIALYNKQEFINKMTLPIGSLQNIEILSTVYEKEQMVEIRFLSK